MPKLSVIALVALAAVVLLALLGAWALWMRAVLWRYRLRERRPERLTAVTSDGWELAVYYRPAPNRRFEEPVLLCHGLAVNHYNFDFDPPYSVAHALAEAGFDCFTVEWRGTGGSQKPPEGRSWGDFCADDHIDKDAPALIELALRKSGAKQVFWLGHSLGGLIGYATAAGPMGGKIKGLLALGAPVYFRYDSALRRALNVGTWAARPLGRRQRWMTVTTAPFLGYVTLPLTDLIINPEGMTPKLQRQVWALMMSSVSYKLLLQFKDWITHDAFRSFDRQIDYRARLSQLTLPMLVMGGSADKLATPDNVRAQAELPRSEDKTVLIFGKENGDRLDYGHGDLLFGTYVPEEIYPRFAEWLIAHGTALKLTTELKAAARETVAPVGSPEPAPPRSA